MNFILFSKSMRDVHFWLRGRSSFRDIGQSFFRLVALFTIVALFFFLLIIDKLEVLCVPNCRLVSIVGRRCACQDVCSLRDQVRQRVYLLYRRGSREDLWTVVVHAWNSASEVYICLDRCVLHPNRLTYHTVIHLMDEVFRHGGLVNLRVILSWNPKKHLLLVNV